MLTPIRTEPILSDDEIVVNIKTQFQHQSKPNNTLRRSRSTKPQSTTKHNTNTNANTAKFYQYPTVTTIPPDKIIINNNIQ